jgi:HTH-type transcriptional regulator/antitoxin HipB
MAAGEQVNRALAQLVVLLKDVRRQQGLSQQDLTLKAGGTSQARLS